MSRLLDKLGWVYRSPPTGSFAVNKDSPQAVGLIGWWPSVGSRGANTLLDLSGYARHGSFVNTPTWANQATLGPVLDHDLNDYINLGSIGSYTTFTLAAWAVLDTYDASNGPYRYLAGRANAFAWGVRNAVDSNRLGVWLYDRAWAWYGTTWTPTLGTLYHWCMTRDAAANVSHYIDGALLTTSTSTKTPQSNTNATQLRAYNSGESWDGMVGDQRFYNRALSAAEVRQLYDPQTRWELYRPLVPRRRYYVAATTTITPDPVTVPLSIPAPTVSLSLSVAPDPVTIPTATPAPTLSLAYNVAPDPVTIPTALPAVSLSFGAISLSPDAVAIPLALPAVTVNAGALTISPDSVAIATAIPAPTLAHALSLAPSPIAVPLVIPAPTLSLLLSLSPDALTIPLVIPAPTVDTGQTILTPSPVAIPLSLPSPTLAMGPTSLATDPVTIAMAIAAPALAHLLTVAPDPVAVPLVIAVPSLSHVLSLSPSPVTIPLVIVAVTVSGAAGRPDIKSPTYAVLVSDGRTFAVLVSDGRTYAEVQAG